LKRRCVWSAESGSLDRAKAFLEIQKEFGRFDRYIRHFIGGKPIQNRHRSMKQVPVDQKVRRQTVPGSAS